MPAISLVNIITVFHTEQNRFLIKSQQIKNIQAPQRNCKAACVTPREGTVDSEGNMSIATVAAVEPYSSQSDFLMNPPLLGHAVYFITHCGRCVGQFVVYELSDSWCSKNARKLLHVFFFFFF